MQTPDEATTKMKLLFAAVIPVIVDHPKGCSRPLWTKNCSCKEVKYDNIKIELNTEKEIQSSRFYNMRNRMAMDYIWIYGGRRGRGNNAKYGRSGLAGWIEWKWSCLATTTSSHLQLEAPELLGAEVHVRARWLPAAQLADLAAHQLARGVAAAQQLPVQRPSI